MKGLLCGMTTSCGVSSWCIVQPVRALPYRTELARQLASLVDLWRSAAFRDDLVSSIGC